MYFLLLPAVITISGAYLLVRLRGFFILHPIRTASEVIVALRDRESRRAFLLALAGTLGVGNIFGVCAGLMIAGPGCVFWLLVSSVFAMIIKYAETMLVFDSGKPKGGMSSVLTTVFPKPGRFLAYSYAALTVMLSLVMGASMQCKAVSDSTHELMGVNPLFVSTFILILFTPCLVGGVSKIEKITGTVVPLTTIIYIFTVIFIIFQNFDRLPSVWNEILSAAFSSEAIIGSAAIIAIKEGFARGILSNEAGMGSSALAHSQGGNRMPHTAGLFGILEVIFDTPILCLLTALAVLCSSTEIATTDSPTQLISSIFSSSFGEFGKLILPILLLSFAYATVICWYFYGWQMISLYFPSARVAFCVFFCLFVLLSPLFSSRILISLTDALILPMTVLTISAILCSSNRIIDVHKRK